MPPKVHDLQKLATLLNLQLTKEQDMFLRQLCNYYIAMRYPEEVMALARRITHSLAQNYFVKTGDFLKWIDGLLK